MPQTTNTEKIILALLAGVAAGVAIGILIAPAKGAETREKLADMADDFTKKIKNTIKDRLSAESEIKS